MRGYFFRPATPRHTARSATAIIAYLNAVAQALTAHTTKLYGREVSRLIAVIPAAIVFIVAVSIGIGAALLGYPLWAIPLIAVFGAGGAIVAIRVLG